MTAWRIGGGLGAMFLVLLIGLAMSFRPDRALRVGLAMVSETLCTQVFVAHLDAERVFREDILPQKGLRILEKRLRYEVDPQRRQVTTSWAGLVAMAAIDRPGLGCLPVAVSEVTPGRVQPRRDTSPAIFEAPLETPPSPALAAALERAFVEPRVPPLHRVRAIVVLRDGKIVAERYAPGITAQTPLLSYSVSKSLINAMVGVLAREHRLDPLAPAAVPAWQNPGDPRRAITPDQLLRMDAGLALDESDSGFDPVSRMLFLEPDMAAFAARAPLREPPASRFNYTSGNTLIVSALVRNAVGGHASDVVAFADRELFKPLDMRNVHLTFDDAGTAVGSTLFLASARDWARFGQLYLNDGVVDGQRILPEGWVKYSTTPTLGSDYGAGFWLNAGNAPNAIGRRAMGFPADSFYASGNFGQRILVIPSERLVIVRFGATVDPPKFDIEGLARLAVDVIHAKG